MRIIVADKYDDKLHHAQPMVKDIEVFIYEVSISLKGHVK